MMAVPRERGEVARMHETAIKKGWCLAHCSTFADVLQ